MSPAEMDRLPDWQQRLDAVVRAWRNEPARCAGKDSPDIFVAEAIEAVIGRVFSDSAAMIDFLGEPSTPPLQLSVGDVGCRNTGESRSAAVVLGAFCISVSQDGLANLKLTELDGGWRIG